jgi:hypothetical protein
MKLARKHKNVYLSLQISFETFFDSDKCLASIGTDAHKSVRASSATVFVVRSDSAENWHDSVFYYRTVRNKFLENLFISYFDVNCVQAKRQSCLGSDSSRMKRRL